MNILKLNSIYILTASLLLSLFAFSCKDDDHYDPDSSIVPDENIMELIKKDPQLTMFASLLEKVDYDKVLASDQVFTVWAPNNDALEGMQLETNEDILKFVKNHVARFIRNASGDINSKIYMENSKILEFTNDVDGYYLGGEKLIEKNSPAQNGVLHILNGRVNYNYNNWEKLEEARFDSIRNFLYPLTTMEFDIHNSEQIGYTADGMPMYDSVFVKSNPFWNEVYTSIPYIIPLYAFRGGFYNVSNEDSVYTMILPTNAAWEEAYERIAPYFVNNNLEGADSIQRYNTQFALVQDLVFRGKIKTDADTLKSTRLAEFIQPAYLFEGAVEEQTSNGMVYSTDLLKYKSWESWCKPIKIEAEYMPTRIDPLESTGATIRSFVTNVPEVSNAMYIYAISSGAVNPVAVEFLIPNTLAATYNISVAFVPDIYQWPNNSKKTKVKFTLSQLNRETKKWNTIATNTDSKNNEVSDTESTKLVAFKDLTLPYAFVNETDYAIKLKIETDVTNPRELGTYQNRMSIDYVLFEPVHD